MQLPQKGNDVMLSFLFAQIPTRVSPNSQRLPRQARLMIANESMKGNNAN